VASSQHFADPLLRNRRAASAKTSINTVGHLELFAPRSTRWTAGQRGRAAAPSRIPRRADGTLVAMRNGVVLPKIPASRRRAAERAEAALISAPIPSAASTKEPPRRAGRGLRGAGAGRRWRRQRRRRDPLADVAAPLGTYTGWNCAPAASATARRQNHRSYVPFPSPPEERQATAIRAAPCWSVIAGRRPMSRRSPKRPKALVAEGFDARRGYRNCVKAAAGWGRPRMMWDWIERVSHPSPLAGEGLSEV